MAQISKPVFYNVKTLEVIEIVRTVETMDEALDFDGEQMQVIHKNLPMVQADKEVIEEWMREGRSITSIPVYGRTGTAFSHQPIKDIGGTEQVATIVTTDPELGNAFVKRMNDYMQFGTFEALFYCSIEEYAAELNCTSAVVDPSVTAGRQVAEAAMVINNSEDSANCSWEHLSTLHPKDCEAVVKRISALSDVAVPPKAKATALVRFAKFFAE